jgi:radical SAM protein with 4Fe4S-binding SPASM domain
MNFHGLFGFHHLNEPLLSKDKVLKFAAIAKNLGMKPYLITNGDALTKDPTLCRETEKLFDFIRIGIYDFKTDKDLELEKQRWRNFLPGCKKLIFSTIKNTKPNNLDNIILNGDGPVIIPLQIRKPSKNKGLVCHRPLLRLIIRNDGEVLNCSEDIYASFRLGNVFEKSIREIWFSKEHIKIIMNLLSGRRDKYDLCEGCPREATKSMCDIS